MRANLELRARLGLGLMLAPILELNLWLELGGKLIGAGPGGLKYFNTVRAPPGGVKYLNTVGTSPGGLKYLNTVRAPPRAGAEIPQHKNITRSAEMPQRGQSTTRGLK